MGLPTALVFLKVRKFNLSSATTVIAFLGADVTNSVGVFVGAGVGLLVEVAVMVGVVVLVGINVLVGIGDKVAIGAAAVCDANISSATRVEIESNSAWDGPQALITKKTIVAMT